VTLTIRLKNTNFVNFFYFMQFVDHSVNNKGLEHIHSLNELVSEARERALKAVDKIRKEI